jgi:hypothetical protein
VKSTGRVNHQLRQLWSGSYDQCRTCGSRLPSNCPVYAGYAVDGTPLYVGDCCRPLIHELASHVYWWWERDKRCAPATRLWRYLDLAKFVALLDQRALNFARADQLGDTFEGSSGIADRRPEWDAHYLEFFRQAIRTVPGPNGSPPHEEVEREANRLLQEMSAGVERDRQEYFVSCWHENAGESEALWRLYCPPPTTGVAIETTVERLTSALGEAPFRLGAVYYVDLKQAFPGVRDRIFAKRRSLSHEREVRAVIRQRDELGSRLSIPIDLETLLVSIVPSPFAPAWFPGLLESLLVRFGVSARLSRSELLADPFF